MKFFANEYFMKLYLWSYEIELSFYFDRLRPK